MPHRLSRRSHSAARPILVTCVVALTACTAAPIPEASRTMTSPAVKAAIGEQPTVTPVPNKPTLSRAPSTVPTTPPIPTRSAISSTSAISARPAVPAPPTHPRTAIAPDAGPVIVLDPGHAPTISHTDPATGLTDSDYENEPEMRDVFAVAELVRAKLVAAGYRVVMTKNSVNDRVSLGQRAAIANDAHAALALSIHDQAGAGGGIGFEQGNNIVYYQAVGDYRVAPDGAKVEFTDSRLAATSLKYGTIFQRARQAAEGVGVRLQGDTGYDLGSRGLAAGDIWIVQLLSKVPWIYNEAGGNSPGMSGLDAADQQRYADGLVAAVQRCVPVH